MFHPQSITTEHTGKLNYWNVFCFEIFNRWDWNGWKNESWHTTASWDSGDFLPKLWQRCNDQLSWFCGEETSCVVLPTYCWRMSQWEIEIYWAHRWSLWLKANMCTPLPRRCRSLSARQIFFSEKLSDKFYERISCSPKKLSAHQNLLTHGVVRACVCFSHEIFSAHFLGKVRNRECGCGVSFSANV